MWFVGAEENKCVTDSLCFTPLDYDKPLQTNMSSGTAWLCWGREYPSVMWGESSTALEQRLQKLDYQMSWWMNAVVWK